MMRRQFPGKQAADAQTKLALIVNHAREALELRSRPRQPITVDQADAALTDSWYFLAYTHPVHSFKNRLLKTGRDALISFLRAEFHIEQMTGVDIVIASSSMSMFIIGNHDGELFLVANPK